MTKYYSLPKQHKHHSETKQRRINIQLRPDELNHKLPEEKKRHKEAVINQILIINKHNYADTCNMHYSIESIRAVYSFSCCSVEQYQCC